MTYADGSEYKGEWTADKRNGTGTYKYANGDTYDGGWKEGGRHGKGTYFFAQHSCQFFGYWNTGSFAWGTWVFKDGTTFAGKFSDGPMQPRPASRAPGAFYAAKTQQAGRIKGGRWAPTTQMVPAASRLHWSGAAPRKFPVHLQPAQDVSLNSILSSMEQYEIPSAPEMRPQTAVPEQQPPRAGSVPTSGNVLIYGPPGSGRSTQSSLLAEKYGAVVISTGKLLRQEIEQGTELGTQAREFVDSGGFVPDELVQQIVEPVLLSAEVKQNGFVMYGYPRTASQVEHLLKIVRIDALFVLDVSLGVSMHKLIERCCLRRVDPEMGTVYSLADHDALDGLSADIKNRLVVADGDNSEDKIQKRIELFVQNSAEVCNAFPDEIVHSVDADRNALTILHDIGVIAFGEEVAATYGDRAAASNRDETLCKKLAWSLRDQYHEHAPEVEVDNSEHFDEDPDLHAKRHSADNGKHERPLTVLHFNDVYEIKEGKQEPVGGAARIAGKMHDFDDLKPLVLFSGDALNPSLISQSTRGSHMIEVLNALGVAASVIGNHDLDFGVENLCANIAKSDFPWLCSNCWHKETGEPLAGGIEACIIQHQGYNIGLVGLIEEEWLACCSTINPDCLDCTDLVTVGSAVAKKLRAEEDVDFVIALTHFREPNDERLAVEVPEIDLVLGGHDHHYASKKCEPHGTWYVKSGADFRYLSKITMQLPETGDSRPQVDVEKHEITRAVPEDETVKAICDKYLKEMEKTMGRTIGHVKTVLDARFTMVRTQETNVGNWCADVMRRGCKCDIVLLNAGTLRADCTYPPGSFTVEDLMKLLPFANELMVVELNGAQVLHCLENSVSSWPKKDGRFVQVSGIKFEFDGSKPAMQRIVDGTVMVATDRGDPGTDSNPYVPIDPEARYSVGALDFAAKGNEGFTAFLDGKVLMDEEVCTPLGTLMRNNLTALEALNHSSFAKISERDSTKVAAKSFLGLSKKYKQAHEKHWTEMEAEGDPAFGVNPVLQGRIQNHAKEVDGTVEVVGPWYEYEIPA
jgi:5'-nucleotidase